MGLRGTKRKLGLIVKQITSKISVRVRVRTMTSIVDQTTNMQKITTIMLLDTKEIIMMTEVATSMTNQGLIISGTLPMRIGGILKATMTIISSHNNADEARSVPINAQMISTRLSMEIDADRTGNKSEISIASSRDKKKRSNNASYATQEMITRRGISSSTMLASVANSSKINVPAKKNSLMVMRKIVSPTHVGQIILAVEAFLTAVVVSNKAGIRILSVIKKTTQEILMPSRTISKKRLMMTTRLSKSKTVSTSSRRRSLTRGTTTSSRRRWTLRLRKTAK